MYRIVFLAVLFLGFLSCGDDVAGPGNEEMDVPCETNHRVSDGRCIPCEPGTFNNKNDDPSGIDTVCEPVLCAENELVRVNVCEPCPSGSVNLGGDDASGLDTSCEENLRCPANQYVVDNSCMACPAGTTNAEGDAVDTNTTCDITYCSANQHVVDNSCSPCVAGTNAAGDDASGADTTCDGELCPSNQHVVDNTCVQCVAGTTNAAGDDAAKSNTFCDVIFCAANQHVVENTCVQCALETTNAAGDDASGENTSCDIASCAADQYVSANTCTACPSGTVNAAGDDPSGADTECGLEDDCYLALGVFCDEFDQGYIKASNTDEGDSFGFAVAIDGDTLVVGAYLEESNATGVEGNQSDNSAPRSGAAYIFTRSGTTWSQQAYLKASNAEFGDRFGHSVAISNDTVVVGALTENGGSVGVGGDQANNNAHGSGAAYVFTRTGTTWTQQAYIKASNTGGPTGDKFGHAVAIHGDTLAVGANAERSAADGINGDQTDDSANAAGAVYVFTRNGTTWSQQAYIKASNSDFGDGFGHALALESNTLAIAAVSEQSSADGIGGDQTDNSLNFAGAVYVFTRTGTTWSQQAYIKASNSDTGDAFGYSVALDRDTLAVGAFGERSSATGVGGDQSDNGTFNAGAVYVFTRAGTTWSQQAYFKASNSDVGDRFGDSVSLEGDMLAVGARNESSSATGIGGNQTNNNTENSGAVYVFTRKGTAWSQQGYIKSSNSGVGDRFGLPVAIDKNTLVVGAPVESSSATGVGGDQSDNSAHFSGSVYVRIISP